MHSPNCVPPPSFLGKAEQDPSSAGLISKGSVWVLTRRSWCQTYIRCVSLRCTNAINHKLHLKTLFTRSPDSHQGKSPAGTSQHFTGCTSPCLLPPSTCRGMHSLSTERRNMHQKKKRKQIKKRGSELPWFHTKQQRTDVHAWDLTSGKQSSPRSTIPGTQTCQHTNSGINIKEGNDAWPEDQHLRELVREFPLQEDPSPQPGISTSMERDAAIPPGGNQVGFFVSSRLWVWKRASLPPAARSLAQRDELPKAPGTGGSFA